MKGRQSVFIPWRLKERTRELLSKERGTTYKDHGGRVSVCLVYPNTYYVGMSNLGFQFVYGSLNLREDCVCERAFLPERDELDELRVGSIPLFSLESQTPLNRFDIIAFSLSFEEDYLNIPTILRLCNIPVYARDRGLEGPLLLGGGCAVSMNPEPLGDIFDILFIGEADGILGNIIDLYQRFKRGGMVYKEGYLYEVAHLEGVYVPSFYGFTYDGPVVKSIRVLRDGIKPRVTARKVRDIDSAPLIHTVVTTPWTEFSGTCLVEIERGCPEGCRFCTAGFIYLPPRWRRKEGVLDGVRKGLEDTKKVGLVGSAVSEYPYIKDVLREGTRLGGELTVSSLRADILDEELLHLLKGSGYRTVTIAPEAGSERLRRIINKPISDDNLLRAVELAEKVGLRRLKLYYLLGLPCEEDGDAEAIAELTLKMKAIFSGSISLSVNPFVPKPFTPFQWHPLEKREVVGRRFSIIKGLVSKKKGITVKTISTRRAVLQTYLSRGDRRVGGTIVDASMEGISGALRKADPPVEGYVYRERTYQEILPWDIVDFGIRKEYLWDEYQRGLEGKTTPPCNPDVCTRCGVCGNRG